MIMKISVSIFFSLLMLMSHAQSISSFNNYLQNNNQVLFVKTNSDTTINGMMFLYERKNQHKQWHIKDSFNVVVGKNGLGKDVTASINLKYISIQ